ncbi:hypothetical protein HELRODRAFT_138305, partial [Helobdella robusta]|uniref:Nuclear receptor domain-containing protein n=1 Tax=Helobdella robusta TaxID=6412 RepID=T1EIT2_HELRO
CRICGDRSSGNHYGIVSCEGCKSFFKRAVRNGSQFRCKKFGACEVTLTSRTQCPGCRMDRCLKMGMK